MESGSEFALGAFYACLLGGGGYFFLRLSRSPSRVPKLEPALFLAAFCLRLLASFAIYQWGLVDILGDEDGIGWEIGQDLSDDWTDQQLGVMDIPSLWVSVF